MIVTAWILLVCFGIMTLKLMKDFLFDGLSFYGIIVLMLTSIISAISAGIIWGGLFKNLA